MDALLLSNLHQPGTPLRRLNLSAASGYDEHWLQALLHAYPSLVPLDHISPGAGPYIPLTREFAFRKAEGTVYLDLLGVSPAGRVVLIECKLWRNPGARREVVGQVLEYASLLRGWTYGDLTATLKGKEGWTGENPIYANAQALVPELDETRFVENVSASLARGDFLLVIAGDGIRSDLQAMAEHLNATAMSAARLGLVEVGLWADEGGRVVVLPRVPVRTEVIEQRVLVGVHGAPLQVEPMTGGADEAPTPALGGGATRVANRNFWQTFIDELRFDHPDQPAPTHGGDNWVRMALPTPARGMIAYREGCEIGVAATLADAEGAALYEQLAGEADVLREESGLALEFNIAFVEPFRGKIRAARRVAAGESEAEQRAWVTATANRLVTLLRPRLSQWRVDHEMIGSGATTH